MAFTLVLLAALFHALWNVLLKGSQQPFRSLVIIRSVGLVMGVTIMLIAPTPPQDVIVYAVIAALIHLGYFYFLLNAYAFGDVSQVYPISRGLAPLLVLIFSLLFLQESLPVLQIAAISLICLGIFAMVRGQHRPPGKAMVFAVDTAVCIAGYTLVSGLGVRAGASFWVYAGWLEGLTSSMVITLGLLSPTRRRALFEAGPILPSFTAGVLSVSAYTMVLWAMTVTSVAAVAALRETSILFVALLGTVMLREPFGWSKTFAALVICSGVGLLQYASAH